MLSCTSDGDHKGNRRDKQADANFAQRRHLEPAAEQRIDAVGEKRNEQQDQDRNSRPAFAPAAPRVSPKDHMQSMCFA